MRSPWFDIAVSCLLLGVWHALRAEGPMTPVETMFVVWAQGGAMVAGHRLFMHGGQQ